MRKRKRNSSGTGKLKYRRISGDKKVENETFLETLEIERVGLKNSAIFIGLLQQENRQE